MRSKLALLLSALFLCLMFTGLAVAQQKVAPVASQADMKAADADIALMRQDLRSQKKALVAANLPLSGDEAAKFWPVYEQYTAETTKLGDKKTEIIKDYAQNYGTMTDQQAHDFIKNWLVLDESTTQLRVKYVPIFEKVISPKKTALFMQLDRRIGLLFDVQLAGQIPVVQAQ